MNKLDNPETLLSLDKDNMAIHVASIPYQIENSLVAAKEINIPDIYKQVENICFVGMGGSASAADLLLSGDKENMKKSCSLVRFPELPGWIRGEKSLVVILSHSGETEETVAAFKEAAARETQIIVIAENGRLEEMGEIEGALVYDYDTTATPRASLGYQFGFLVHLANELGIFEEKIDLGPALELVKNLNEELKPESPTENNLAKNLAFRAFDHLPIVLASGILSAVGRRFKNQFNENGKNFSAFDEMPEAMHNSIEGTSFPIRAKDDNLYIFLRNSLDKDFVQKRYDLWIEVLAEKKIDYELVEAQGEDEWSQKLSLLTLGDWTSFYLALLNNIDPTPVPTIMECKEKLKK
jgi:glucose/mannose-6-phosphate isomerase